MAATERANAFSSGNIDGCMAVRTFNVIIHFFSLCQGGFSHDFIKSRLIDFDFHPQFYTSFRLDYTMATGDNNEREVTQMPFLTHEQAAAQMGVSEDTVLNWVKAGRLRASKLSGTKTLRISTEDIMAFYDANETRPKEGGQ